jgi:hypothetical protein
MQSQRSSQTRAGKKIRFFELQNLFFFSFFFFILLTPPTSSVHKLFFFFFLKLSYLDCSEIAI